MMMMHTVKYEYQIIWPVHLWFDVVHIQDTEIITYSSHVHAWWDTKWNVASKYLVFLCINEHEDSLVGRVPSGVSVCVLMHVTERDHRNCKTSLSYFHCYQASRGTNLEQTVAVGHYTYSKSYEVGLSIIPNLLWIFITEWIQDVLSSSCVR